MLYSDGIRTYKTHSEIRRHRTDLDLPSRITDELLFSLGFKLVPKPPESLDEWRAYILDQTRKTVIERLDSLEWRAERAQERIAIGVPISESLREVLQQREAIRVAGNRSELEIEALETIEELKVYQFEVKPEDYPPVVVLTKLEFLRRFTQQERVAIRSIRNPNHPNGPLLEDFWELLNIAQDVRLTDPDIIAAVTMLEQGGVLSAGRAAEILTP